MQLLKLLKNVDVKEIIGNIDIEIDNLSFKSAKQLDKCLYFCLEGQFYDGHLFADEAVKNGAIAVVTNRVLDIDIVQIVVDETRSCMSTISNNFYDNPNTKLKIVCVIGTNGKTSTSYIAYKLFLKAKENTGLIGTNGVYINELRLDNDMTTPDPIELNKILKLMVDSHIKYVVMEVSAHAIALNKLDSITADVSIFTNFSQDHLDFFHDMDTYKSVKKSFFNRLHTKIGIINSDDLVGRELLSECNIPIVSYGIDNAADVFAMDCYESDKGINYTLNIYDEVVKIDSKLCGHFNIYNTLAAATAVRVFGIKADIIAQGIYEINCIEGRNETINTAGGVRVVVDFAHTPEGIKNILSYLKQTTLNRLIAVFGCGGDRDKSKRVPMAQAVSTYCDYAILTTDNPRSEDATAIILDTRDGIAINHEIIVDRGKAIAQGLLMALKGDTIAILGKGNEIYQIFADKKVAFSDINHVKNLIKN